MQVLKIETKGMCSFSSCVGQKAERFTVRGSCKSVCWLLLICPRQDVPSLLQQHTFQCFIPVSILGSWEFPLVCFNGDIWQGFVGSSTYQVSKQQQQQKRGYQWMSHAWFSTSTWRQISKIGNSHKLLYWGKPWQPKRPLCFSLLDSVTKALKTSTKSWAKCNHLA